MLVCAEPADFLEWTSLLTAGKYRHNYSIEALLILSTLTHKPPKGVNKQSSDAAAARAIESQTPNGVIQDNLVCKLLEGSKKSQQLQALHRQVCSPLPGLQMLCCWVCVVGLDPHISVSVCSNLHCLGTSKQPDSTF